MNDDLRLAVSPCRLLEAKLIRAANAVLKVQESTLLRVAVQGPMKGNRVKQSRRPDAKGKAG